MNKFTNRQIKTIAPWIAVVLLMVLIFQLSSQVAEESDELSIEVTETVTDTIGKVAPSKEYNVDRLNKFSARMLTFLSTSC